jgi:ABC-2 type transport system ATP-binding protein
MIPTAGQSVLPEPVAARRDGVASPIVVENLSKTYRDGWIFRKKFPALTQVSLTVNRGEVFGLLGPNGAGKTTLLKILLGIISKSGGNARLLGRPAGSRLGRAHVGYLPEQLRIPRHLTGYTALDYYGRLSGMASSRIRQKRDSLLEFVGLAGRGADRITKYSKGMLQRLGLAQALLHDPQLLILDEPTDGLDPGARAEMRQLMQQMGQRGVTIFLNSHLLQEVEMVCDRVAILHRGHLHYCGGVREIGEFLKRGTRDAGIVVHLVLDGDVAAIRDALAGASGSDEPAADIQPNADGLVAISRRFASQDDIDRTVDRLRAASVSLLRLTREAINLEQAFLQIVSRAETARKDGAEPRKG